MIIVTFQYFLLVPGPRSTPNKPYEISIKSHEISSNQRPPSHCPNTPLPARADRLANLAGVQATLVPDGNRMVWGPMDEFRWSQIVSVLLPKMFTISLINPASQKTSSNRTPKTGMIPFDFQSHRLKVKQPFNSLLLELASNCAAEITILRGYLQKRCLILWNWTSVSTCDGPCR